MTVKLVAAGGWMRTVTALVALVAAATTLIAAAATPARAATTQTPVLAEGAGMGSSPSTAVRRVQRLLRNKGYSLGQPGIDGRFGPLTAAAVRRLQTDYGLKVDGVVGPKTRKLVRLIERRPQRPSTARKKSEPRKRGTSSGGATPNSGTASSGGAATQPPAPQPAANNNDNSGNTAGWLALMAIVAALAALGVALFAARGKRPRGRPAARGAITALPRELYLEGHSEDPRIADFRGNAFAATIAGDPAGDPMPGETWYLIDDVRKPTPVWVSGAEVRRSPSRLAQGEAVIGYVSVASEGQRADADAAAHQIERACEHSQWELAEVVTDRENGRALERPGLAYALEQIAEGKARGLVVTDLRRLSRSIIDLGILMEWFRDAQAALVALDLGVDTSTPSGHEVAATLITLGDWERERIAQRTRSGLAEVRASGRAVGRPAVSDRPDLVERINAMRSANMTLQAIADQLNAEGVPTLRGGAMWRPSSVQAALGYRRPGTRSARDQLPTLEDRA
jgi:DNA invertase Pin-like site-specific DNA recombinase/peptidoglycan hydrolase-like protein with peptidoglycan-binding domain